MRARLPKAALLSSALALQACVAVPMGAPVEPVSEAGAYRPTSMTGILSLGVQVPFAQTSGLDGVTGRELGRIDVTISRDGFILDERSLPLDTSKGKIRLNIPGVLTGDVQVAVSVYDGSGQLLGRGTTLATVFSRTKVPATVVVQPTDSEPTFSYTPIPTPTPIPAPTQAPTGWSLPNPDRYFISQMYDAKWNPSAPSWTQNCGPASLAMALEVYNVLPPLLSQFGDPEDLIHKTREAMMSSQDDFQNATLEDLERGEDACGLYHERVYGVAGVRSALQAGRLVILAGDPVAYSARFTSSQYAAFDGGHFVLVTGMDETKAYLNDPLSHVGNISVSLSELQAYMAYQHWNVGTSVFRRPSFTNS